jgi:TATA-binding protein-associated factor
VEAILSNVDANGGGHKFDKELEEEEILEKFDQQQQQRRLTFDKFDVDSLLTSNNSNFLMASEAKVFDQMGPNASGSVSNSTGSTNSSSIGDSQRQRELINKRLGLDIAEKMGIDTSDIVTNADLEEDEQELVIEEEVSNNSTASNSRSYYNNIPSFDPNLEENLSSRELNLAKRRARKQRSVEQSSSKNSSNSTGGECSSSTPSKKYKREDSDAGSESMSTSTSLSIFEGNDDEWPLGKWTDVLVNDIFSPQWEVRHGAATALREVIKIHGDGGGREGARTKKEVRKDTVRDYNALRGRVGP